MAAAAHFMNASMVMRTHTSVRSPERWASAIGGAALAVYGVRRFTDDDRTAGALLATAGSALLWRGVTPIDRDTRRRLAGSRGINVEESVTVSAPAADLYRLWRDLEWLPAIFPGLVSVRVISSSRSRWVAELKGKRVAWTAEIINEVPGELIAWRTLGDADVVSAGSVHFTPATGCRGTVVRVRLQYEPPGGKLGAVAAWMLGGAPSSLLREGLRHFKQLIEASELPTNQLSSRNMKRAAKRGVE
jgi:uncharacterized membrane protein